MKGEVHYGRLSLIIHNYTLKYDTTTLWNTCTLNCHLTLYFTYTVHISLLIDFLSWCPLQLVYFGSHIKCMGNNDRSGETVILYFWFKFFMKTKETLKNTNNWAIFTQKTIKCNLFLQVTIQIHHQFNNHRPQ